MVLAKPANESQTKYHLYNITIISKVNEQKMYHPTELFSYLFLKTNKKLFGLLLSLETANLF
jgi:hypothetical protein